MHVGSVGIGQFCGQSQPHRFASPGVQLLPPPHDVMMATITSAPTTPIARPFEAGSG